MNNICNTRKIILSIVGLITLGSSSLSFGMNIFRAIEEGDQNRVKEILKDKNFNVNQANDNGQTPLWWACWLFRNLEIIELLLANGAKKSINKTDNSNITPFSFACSNNNLEIVKLFLEYGANFDEWTLRRAQRNLQNPEKRAIATQILEAINLTQRFDTWHKRTNNENMWLENITDKGLIEFAQKLKNSTRCAKQTMYDFSTAPKRDKEKERKITDTRIHCENE